MSDKKKKTIKIIVITCVVILLIDILFLVYMNFFRKEERAYYDLVNAVYESDNYLVSVGSNNDNDDSLERGIITKYSSDYDIVWTKLYNKGYNGTFFDVIGDGDDIVAVGSYESTKEENESNLRTAFIVKYDSDGNVIFEKDFQILGNSKFNKIKVVEDGYIVVGQSIYENSTLGLSEDGGAVVLKYDTQGELVWQNNYGGSKSGVYNDLIIEDNYIYAVGKDYSRTGIVSKISLDGEIIETVEYNFVDTIGFSGIEVIGGELVVIGAKKVSEDDDDYDTDGLVVKYSKDLKYLDEVIYRDKGVERFNQVVVDKDNDIVLIGTSALYDKVNSTDTKNEFIYNGVIAKYKSDLSNIKVEQYGEDRDDYFTDIILSDESYLVSGYSEYNDFEILSKFINYNNALEVIEVK